MMEFVCPRPPIPSRTSPRVLAERILNGQQIRRRNQVNGSPTLQLNELQLCYFAALIHALRLIDEKAEEKGVTLLQVDPDALVDYVRAKGDELVALYECERKVAA